MLHATKALFAEIAHATANAAATSSKQSAASSSGKGSSTGTSPTGHYNGSSHRGNARPGKGITRKRKPPYAICPGARYRHGAPPMQSPPSQASTSRIVDYNSISADDQATFRSHDLSVHPVCCSLIMPLSILLFDSPPAIYHQWQCHHRYFRQRPCTRQYHRRLYTRARNMQRRKVGHRNRVPLVRQHHLLALQWF